MVFSFNFKLNVLFSGKTCNIFENLKLFFRFVLQVEKTVAVLSTKSYLYKLYLDMIGFWPYIAETSFWLDTFFPKRVEG